MTGPLNPMHATAPHEWAFVAQGGANLAFGYKGDSVEHHFDGRLLRVRKLNAHPASAELTAEERDKLELGFGTEVVEPLLGSEFVLPVTSHAGDGNWLDELRELLSQSGSAAADRSGGGEVDVAASHIQVVDNLTHGQGTLAIEIKPKWGFLPRPPPGQSPTTPTACRFCKHSSLRRAGLPLTARYAAHQSNYCPLDLYTGEEGRVERAVRALVAAWRDSGGRQNNLRVFWEGRRVDPSDGPTLQRIEQALRGRRPDNLAREETDFLLLEAHIISSLLASPILARLRTLQSSFAPLTVSRLLPSLPAPLPNQPTLAAWKKFVANYPTSPLTPTSPVEDLLLGHSLSATFKDCSVFLRSARDGTAGLWRDDVKAIDLDPKPLGKVHKWATLEGEVDEAWEREAAGWRAKGWRVRECYV